MMLSTAQIRELLQTIPFGYKNTHDNFFKPINEQMIGKFKKLGVISTDIDDTDNIDSSHVTLAGSLQGQSTEIYCNVPSCKRFFESVAAYQSHFDSVHRYICAQCNKSLPTPHLLDLHILEQHDSYFAVRVERGEEIFECFLEECKIRFVSPTARKQHCIETHKFPVNFRFDQLPHTQQRQEKNPQCSKDKHGNEADRKMIENEEKLFKNKKQVYSFGHQKLKTFNAASGRQQKNITGKQEVASTLDDMDHLKDVLDEMS